jgi:sterol desaturase/sphingolipid hydroxylase (fatty acid hydroxylase superfamily)
MLAITDTLLVIISTPIYAVLMGLEWLLGFKHQRPSYRLKDTLNNLFLSMLNGAIDLIFRVFYLGVLIWCFQNKLFSPAQSVAYWLSLLILEDIAFYWLHRFDHQLRLFWAVHVTHHSSEEFNLSVGFRSSVLQPLYKFVYFMPLAWLGFRPEDILLVFSATQIYGILLHTRHIGKLGWLEYVLATPSHHRVHHGSNVRYLDKNMGMVFIIWDRLFGTFQEELSSDLVKYGLTTPLNTDDPRHIIFHEWKAIWRDVSNAPNLKIAWQYLWAPPGWSHDGRSYTSKELRQLLALAEQTGKVSSLGIEVSDVIRVGEAGNYLDANQGKALVEKA